VSGYLIDTHVFLWLLTDESQLSPSVLSTVLNRHNTLLLSVISVTEMAIKVSNKKLDLKQPLETFVKEGMMKFKMLELVLRRPHALKLAELPMHHRDPFDRLLLAQAAFEGLTLLSQDKQMQSYGVPVIS
jgi:PIN domain nuclease of toxin-antitoxin system